MSESVNDVSTSQRIPKSSDPASSDNEAGANAPGFSLASKRYSRSCLSNKTVAPMASHRLWTKNFCSIGPQRFATNPITIAMIAMAIRPVRSVNRRGTREPSPSLADALVFAAFAICMNAAIVELVGSGNGSRHEQHSSMREMSIHVSAPFTGLGRAAV